MLKVHTRDGRTVRVDLEDRAASQAWLQRLRDPVFQAEVTGLTISHRGVSYSLPRPKGFDPILFSAELVAAEQERRIKGGERLVCQAGEVRAVVMVHREQRAARVTLFRIGKARYIPPPRID